jgi:dCMP deaminase
MARISREEMWMRMAEVAAERGTCRRLKVGAVLVTQDTTHIRAIGYNGNAAGLPNDCDFTSHDAAGICGCLHAELNALLKGRPSALDILFTTHCPCTACAKAIINSGVKQVYYRHAYRRSDGYELLLAAGVTVTQLQPSSNAIQ